MQIFCGTDIIEIDRIKKSLDMLGDKFRDRVFTEKEVEYCESKRSARYQSYAARFAGKEAVSKAFGTGLTDKLWLNDIEILNDANGKPCVYLSEKAVQMLKSYKKYGISISLSHCENYAVAFAVLYLED